MRGKMLNFQILWKTHCVHTVILRPSKCNVAYVHFTSRTRSRTAISSYCFCRFSPNPPGPLASSTGGTSHRSSFLSLSLSLSLALVRAAKRDAPYLSVDTTGLLLVACACLLNTFSVCSPPSRRPRWALAVPARNLVKRT